MWNALIVEDEVAAASRLMKMIQEVNPHIQVLAVLDSVSASVRWLEQNPAPDLIFLDINLGDGLSFEIFEQTQISSPIIFTTAYDQYAIRAFKTNSIDYLLKPIKKEELRFSLNKFENLAKTQSLSSEQIKKLIHDIRQPLPDYQKRFIVQFADKIKAIETQQIACFFSMERSTFFNTFEDQSFAIPYTLEKLETLLDPLQFFRINRKYIIRFEAISQMHLLSRSRIKLEVKTIKDDDCIVSSDRSSDFKNWLNR